MGLQCAINTEAKKMREYVRNRGNGVETVSPICKPGTASSAPEACNLVPIVHERRLLRVMQTIESRLPHSVKELAQEVRLSPAHLQRLFKQETGIDIGEMLSERRLFRAADLLKTTNMGVKEVAYVVGYGHHSSFVRAFHRRFGQSPRRYRLRAA